MINDCSGFNVVIRDIEPCIAFFNKGWFIYNVDFTVEPFGGGCSLTHCGVEPPVSPEEIERRIRQFYDEWGEGPYSKGGWDFKTEKDKVWMRLSKGLPICDDQGKRITDESTKPTV